QFEKELAKKVGVKYAITTNSGSSANLLAVSCLTSFRLGRRRLKKGDEVITLACGFPSTINPIIQMGLVPVLIDLELKTYAPKISNIKKAIGPKTKAIFMAHTLGNPADLDALTRLCQKHNLWLIEDNCDALGSTYSNRWTGSFGHLATCSFYPAHHITTGEGGAVLTSDPLLNKIVRSMRDWGRDCWCPTGKNNTCGIRFGWKLGDLPKGYDHKYIYSEMGYNLKFTDIQAALGLAQLKKLSRFIKQRRANFSFFKKELTKHNRYLLLPEATKNSNPSWFGFIITIKDNAPFSREELVTFLDQEGIDTRPIFAGNIIRQPYFKNYRPKHRIAGNLTNSDQVMNRTFWIGVYPGIDSQKRKTVAKAFRRFFDRYSPSRQVRS
ncbi:MAG: lipopolysaccharide biosynthesis protein RfbH, partial [Microgenomates group bacterium]